MKVRASRIALGAGVLAAVFLLAVFSIVRVPDWALDAVGGPHGVARDGGLLLRYRPPAGYDAAALDARARRRGVRIGHDGDALLLGITGVAKAEVAIVADIVTQGGLEFREVVSGSSLADYRHAMPDGVAISIDQWDGPGSLASRTQAYMRAETIDQIAEGYERARAAGWEQPPHSAVLYAHELRWDPKDRDEWRSYLVGDEALLDGSAVESSRMTYERAGHLPAVQIELDRAGTEQFAAITERLTGRKLAILVGSQVMSAPILAGKIAIGRAMIPLRMTGEFRDLEIEAAALIAALSTVALPPGGEIEDERWVPPASIPGRMLLARLAIALIGGALLGSLIGLALWIARPTWQRAPRWAGGRLPLRRAAVTLLAPAAVLGLGWLPPAGFDRDTVLELRDLFGAPAGGVAMLGVGPIIAAYIAVELAILAMPAWRRRRFDPAARIAIGRWVAALGVGLSLIWSYMLVGQLARAPEVTIEPGLTSYAATMSLTAGTLLLAFVAGVIRQYGLGNGYGAVIASGWLIAAIQQAPDQLLDDPRLDLVANSKFAAVAIAAIGFAAVFALRARVGDEREAPLRLPASGLAPQVTAVTAIAAWFVARTGAMPLSGIRLGATLDALPIGGWLVAALVVLVPVWSLAFARPALIATLAARAGLAPPSWTSWWRATLLSLVVLAAAAAASLAAVGSHEVWPTLVDAGAILIATAVALDIADDLQARRRDLVAVWPLYSAQHGEIVRRALGDIDIPCYLQGSHLRAMLAWFGPFAPVDVLVPPPAADDARARIAALFEAASPSPPPPSD